jgi:hypothetical protein
VPGQTVCVFFGLAAAQAPRGQDCIGLSLECHPNVLLGPVQSVITGEVSGTKHALQ